MSIIISHPKPPGSAIGPHRPGALRVNESAALGLVARSNIVFLALGQEFSLFCMLSECYLSGGFHQENSRNPVASKGLGTSFLWVRTRACA
jgi:hypothetical protein